jgi:hypothetical protein
MYIYTYTRCAVTFCQYFRIYVCHSKSEISYEHESNAPKSQSYGQKSKMIWTDMEHDNWSTSSLAGDTQIQYKNVKECFKEQFPCPTDWPLRSAQHGTAVTV